MSHWIFVHVLATCQEHTSDTLSIKISKWGRGPSRCSWPQLIEAAEICLKLSHSPTPGRISLHRAPWHWAQILTVPHPTRADLHQHLNLNPLFLLLRRLIYPHSSSWNVCQLPWPGEPTLAKSSSWESCWRDGAEKSTMSVFCISGYRARGNTNARFPRLPYTPPWRLSQHSQGCRSRAVMG